METVESSNRRMLGAEITCYHLGLSSGKINFVTSQFQYLNPHIFSVYRFIISLYFAGFIAWYIPTSVIENGWTFFIYLTNWTFIVVTCYLLVASFNTLMHYLQMIRRGEETILVTRPSENTEFLSIYKLQWFLYYISANLSFIVTIVYWTALYESGANLFLDLNVHTLTSVVAVIETLFSATPVRLIHVAYPLWYGVVYIFFTIVYWVAGGTDMNDNPYIYPIIDYENEPVTAIFYVLGCVAGVFVCQVILWLMYNLRIKLSRKMTNIEEDEDRLSSTTL